MQRNRTSLSTVNALILQGNLIEPSSVQSTTIVTAIASLELMIIFECFKDAFYPIVGIFRIFFYEGMNGYQQVGILIRFFLRPFVFIIAGFAHLRHSADCYGGPTFLPASHCDILHPLTFVYFFRLFAKKLRASCKISVSSFNR